jgi:two-component system CheB/CheR fusion protein
MARRKHDLTAAAAATDDDQGIKAPGSVGSRAAAHHLIEDKAVNFPIVGIGASAGGLAAFESFFSGLPVDAEPGMAFVLVQHLAPDHKSILTGLIQRYTRMQVFEVEDGMRVRPNCTYIIPPNRDMAFLGDSLQLLEPTSPRGQRLPIDFFFRSLAQDQHERAICVVLSGTGNDGVQGVRAIKGEGGMAMAQDPATTEYDGMPSSAIATGLVDFTLPPAAMGAQLIAYAAHAFGAKAKFAAAPTPKIENALKIISILLRAQTGHDFSQYKPNTIIRRIKRRMALQQIDAMENYVRQLQQAPAEVESLSRDLLIGDARFFRDPQVLKALEEAIVPKLFAGKTIGGSIRVWTPGCATGEESYSLAILLAERQEALKQHCKIQVFATDIDRQALAEARAGLYPASIAADVSPERLARYFSAEADGSAYRIHKTIRDMLIFSEQDVIKDPPFSRLDLISCRNLLSHMGKDVQKKLLTLFYHVLNSNGFLVLGSPETVGDLDNLFSAQDRKRKVYQRKDALPDAAHIGAGGSFTPSRTTMESALPQAVAPLSGKKQPTLQELTERALVQQLVASGALVNVHGDILYIHGRTGLYLEPAMGEVGVYNILKMAREGLRHELTSALHNVASGMEIARSFDLWIKTNGSFTPVNLTVRPVRPDPDATPEQSLFLVILEEATVYTEAEATVAQKSQTNAEIAALRQELLAKDAYLQRAHNDLHCSNEEMQSINEELQSANEELETSKEELQSVNEELATINAELQIKLFDLTRANNDMNNLLDGAGIGTVFVDHDLRILRFTPPATKIINLIQGDVGRPVGHIVSNLAGYDSLVEDARTVLTTLVPKEVEVHSLAGAWYAMRILPYRTLENMIEGAVITFTDITESKRIKAAHTHLAEAVVATLREPLLVLDADLRVVAANPAFFVAFQVTPEATLGQLLCDMDNRQWDIPALHALLGEILTRNAVFNDFKLSHTFETKGKVTLQLNARRISAKSEQSELILLEIGNSPHQEPIPPSA